MKMNQKGFSLIELMIVVAIIGILAAAAVPNFKKFQAKARQSEAKSNLAALYSAEKAFQAEWARYFADFQNIGFQPEGNLRYRVGFGAAGVTSPVGYTGPGVAAGGAAVNFNTSVAAVCAGFCTEMSPAANGVAIPALLAANTVAAGSFTAQAQGDVDGDATWDIWTMTDVKTLSNTTADTAD